MSKASVRAIRRADRRAAVKDRRVIGMVERSVVGGSVTPLLSSVPDDHPWVVKCRDWSERYGVSEPVLLEAMARLATGDLDGAEAVVVSNAVSGPVSGV